MTGFSLPFLFPFRNIGTDLDEIPAGPPDIYEDTLFIDRTLERTQNIKRTFTSTRHIEQLLDKSIER